MWKRLNNPRGAGRPAISEPLMIDDLEDRPYSGNTGLGITQRKPSPRDIGQPPSEPPPRPGREDDMRPKGLPRLPFEPVQNYSQPGESSLRPASSIYSQPSPNPVTTRFNRSQYEANSPTYEEEEEVSPPSSPEYNTSSRQRSQYQTDDQEVSPIDEMPDLSRLDVRQSDSRPNHSNPPSSSIPVLRREKRRNQVAAQVTAAAQNLVTRKEVWDTTKGRTTVNPKWDPYSGEITTSDKGKPQSVKPGAFQPPGLRFIHPQTGMVLGNESSVTGGAKAPLSFSDRVRKLGVTTRNEVPVERPEWQGATRTGRTAVVAPVADRHDLPPMNIPRKSSKRVTSPEPDSYSGASTPVTIIRSGDDETSPDMSQSTEDITDPTIAALLAQSYPSFSPPDDRKINPDPVVVDQSAATQVYKKEPERILAAKNWNRDESFATIQQNFREALNSVSIPPVPEEPYIQPSSRFSVTTYAPSEAQTTPRPSLSSDTPPMPTPPTMYETQQSVLNRKRPQIGSDRSSVISRKAVPGSPIFISMSSSVAQKRTTPLSPTSSTHTNTTRKNLPLTPAEVQSHDLVTSLQAQLDDLSNRRRNIERSIRQMTELMPKDHVLVNEAVRRKREMEKIKVESLREEEADVRRQEHDIGLRLHRAWKRRDKDAEFENTGLWVRRVTS